MTEKENIRAFLSEVVDSTYLDKWFDAPNKAFGGSSPNELIKRGETGALWRMALGLHMGELL